MAIPELRGRSVLITGAASGIGHAAALAFAREGARIVAVDLDVPALAQLRLKVEAQGVRCATHSLDVADASAIQELADSIDTPDVLINNAGIAYLGSFLEGDLSVWRRTLDVNLMGVVHGCRAFVPKMLAAGGPRQLLIVSSAAGIYPMPSGAAYAASKAALWNLAEVLKMELATTPLGITTVCPGVINTTIVSHRDKMAQSVNEERFQRLQAYYRTMGCDPEVVAQAMVRAVRRGDQEVLSGPYAALIHHARRISTGLVRRLMMDNARKLGYL